jgi:ribosomal RNA assembly protein
MPEQIYSNNTRKIIQNKKLIEKEFSVKLNVKEDIVTIEGRAEEEYSCLQAIKAINLGFSVNKAVLLKDENFIFREIPIKPIAKRKDLSQVRGRVIGENRKSLDTIESLTDTFICLHDNKVGIIGSLENVEKAVYVLKRIIAGSKHANMYAWLEKKKVEERQGF